MKKQQKNQLKQVQNQSQQGRSMVEMLGVLAIIGVLSIGGIAGYRWGMDKHVSNQILYEMNLNSAQLAMLLQKGNPDGVTLSLGSPYDEGKFRTVDYGFEYACGDKANSGPECLYLDETMYSMTARGLPKRICNMLSDAASGLAYASELDINGGADECDDTGNIVTVFFDTDTTVEGGIPRPEESETHTPLPEVTEPTTTTATETTTPETTTTTVETTTPEITTTEVTTYTSSATCSSTESTTYTSTYTATPFVTTTAFNGECDDNDDCGANQYCYFSNSDSCTEQKGYKGECRSNTPDGTITINEGQENEKTFIAKNEWMNWWSARNFCLANGKDLANISDLGCADEIAKETYGYCHETKQNNTSRNDKNISSTVTALKGKFENNYFWLYELYNSCDAYSVDFYSAEVFNSSRKSSVYPPLCE